MSYVWIDIETTGLDYQKCGLLEFAFAVTDKEGVGIPDVERRLYESLNRHKAVFPFSVTEHPAVTSRVYTFTTRPWTWFFNEPLRDLKAGLEFELEAFRMHSFNGLIGELLDSSPTHPEPQSVDKIVYRVLSEVFQGPVTAAGNSVWFDLRFMEKFMPLTRSLFTHRLMDMTAVAMFLENRPKFESNHRAAGDVISSIRMFRHYKSPPVL